MNLTNQPIKTILFSALLLTGLSACDSEKKETKTIKNKVTKVAHATPSTAVNTATIKIAQEIYNLPVRLCNKPRTDTFKNESVTHYSILAQQGLIGSKKVTYPIFSISGVTGNKGNISDYKLELNKEGLKKTYSGKAPYDIFKGNNLHYKGQTKEGKKTVPIEIAINCK